MAKKIILDMKIMFKQQHCSFNNYLNRNYFLKGFAHQKKEYPEPNFKFSDAAPVHIVSEHMNSYTWLNILFAL